MMIYYAPTGVSLCMLLLLFSAAIASAFLAGDVVSAFSIAALIPAANKCRSRTTTTTTSTTTTNSHNRVVGTKVCNSSSDNDNDDVVGASIMLSRKDVFQKIGRGIISVTAAGFLSSSPKAVNAFENKLDGKYDDRPKRRGPKPKDLGVSTRTDISGIEDYQGLKHCGAAPNCFVSTEYYNPDDDVDHSVPSWSWPSEFGDGKDGVEKAFQQLTEVLQKYPPGQGNIDGGGFQIVTANNNKDGYIYVQYESYKNGYIDDVEFAHISGNDQEYYIGKRDGPRNVQIRSSSRVGYLDFGVNAKRINYIAQQLRSKGWTAPGVDYATHQNYVIQNELQ